jgi:hypothetical protein
MKQLCLSGLLGVLLLFGAPLHAAECTSQPSVDDILKAEDARYQYQTSNNFDSLDSIFAPEMVYIHSSGQIDNRDQYIRKQTSGILRYVSMKRSDVRVRIIDCVGIITGHGSFEAAVEGKMGNYELVFHSVWAKQGVHLRLVSFQSTPSPINH